MCFLHSGLFGGFFGGGGVDDLHYTLGLMICRTRKGRTEEGQTGKGFIEGGLKEALKEAGRKTGKNVGREGGRKARWGERWH